MSFGRDTKFFAANPSCVSGHRELRGDQVLLFREAAKIVKDPVCGMQVDPVKAGGQSQYQGQSYSFCSSGCKQKFDLDPTLYLQSGIVDAEKEVVMDPVCGMKISPRSAAGSIERGGRTDMRTEEILHLCSGVRPRCEDRGQGSTWLCCLDFTRHVVCSDLLISLGPAVPFKKSRMHQDVADRIANL